MIVRTTLVAVFVFALTGSIWHPPLVANRAASKPLFGLQPFPYDLTMEAFNHVHELAANESTLAIVHRDNGVPWAEALADRAFPESVENEWRDLARRLPSGQPVYLALAPLAEDRVSLAAPSQGSSVPAAIANAQYDAPAVKTAFLNYARRAVVRFRPRFLNLGVEAGELAARSPDRWPAFMGLYEYVRSALKREYPDLMIGISFGLPSLMDAKVSARAKPLVEASDFLGLSFYPYMSPFYEKFGAPPLTPPPGQWQDALAWAAKYTQKPIAICETGYSTRDVNLPAFNLKLTGSPALQEEYIRDLGQIALRQKYVFVVWSIPVDYEALYQRLPPSDGRFLLWQNIGLFDAQLRPKPPFQIWRQLVQSTRVNQESDVLAAARAAGAVSGEDAERFVAPMPVPAIVNTTAPTRLQVAQSGNGIVLTWTAPPGVPPRRYVIAGGDASSPHRLPVMLTEGAATSHVMPGLPGGAYVFRVYAVDPDGLSPPSDDASITVASTSSAPGPPVALQASIDGAVLTARWKQTPFGGSSPSAYFVEFDDVSGHREVVTLPASQHSISQPLVRPVHAVRVRASSRGMLSGASNEVILQEGNRDCRGAPGTPILLPVSMVDGEAIFSWLPATNAAERFRILIRHEAERSSFATRSTSGAGLVWRLPSGRLVAAVVAENACGSSRFSNEVPMPPAEPVRP